MKRSLLLLLLLPLGACGGTDDPPSSDEAVQVAASTSVNPNTPEATGLRWRIWRHDHADLDGDGTIEDIGYGRSYGPIRISTVLSSTGERVTLEGAYGGIDWWAEGYPDLDGRPGREIVLSREFANQNPVVVRLRDGALEIVKKRDKLPFTYGPTAAGSGEAFANDWYVRRGGLYSYRSVESFPTGYETFETPEEYQVRVWSWTLRGDRVRATDEGVLCRRGRESVPVPC